MICVVCNLYASALYRGACERCNTARLCAAREFIHAAEALRVMTSVGIRAIPGYRRRPPSRRGPIEHAMFRLGIANAECVRLRMWSAERSTKRPPWFYGDERSNTR